MGLYCRAMDMFPKATARFYPSLGSQHADHPTFHPSFQDDNSTGIWGKSEEGKQW